MSEVPIEELARGLWRWSAAHPEWRPRPRYGRDVACFALEQDDAVVLVDPLAPPDGSSQADAFWPALDRLVRPRRSLAVMITIPYHVRSAAVVRDRYRSQLDVTVWGHAAAARRLGRSIPVEPVEAKRSLFGGIRAFAIGSPLRQEMPLFFPSHRALAFGDAVVGVEGGLRVWQQPRGERGRTWYRERFLPTLEPLADLDLQHVLVTHGEPALGDGREQLARALTAEPCDYGS